MDKLANQILCCDCVAGMKKLPDGCIDLGLTSPPFDDLRRYGGQPFTDEVFRAGAHELYRVIKPGGILCWDVQDRTKHGNRTGTSFRQALHFQEIGFRWHDTIIIVSNGGRLPCKSHYANVVRYCFVFAKGKPKYVNILRDRPNKTPGNVRRWHARRYDGRVDKGQKTYTTGFYGHRLNVWNYNVGYMNTTKDKDAFEHSALMPEEQAEDLILSYSRPGDLVFDPFCGAGTTCKMALLNDRRYLGMEVHNPYQELAIRRVGDASAEHRQRLDAFFTLDHDRRQFS